METIIVGIIAILIMIIVTFLLWVKLQLKKLNEYFCNAFKVFAYTNGQDARVAAITAAMIVDQEQRTLMLGTVHDMTAELLNKRKDDSEFAAFVEQFSFKALELEKEILSKEWTTDDIISQKKRLATSNPEYLRALNKCDPRIFLRNYPHLFTNNTYRQ